MNTNHTGPLYLVEVRGANGSATQIGRYEEGIRVWTSGQTGWCPACVTPHDLPDSATAAQRDAHPRASYWTHDGEERDRVAMFTSRRAAELAVADGELWNGQVYRIRAARGEQLREGVVIDSYQAPGRPPKGANGPRVNLIARVDPEARRRILAEIERRGIGLGDYLSEHGLSLPG
jgi:hypothetical protein